MNLSDIIQLVVLCALIFFPAGLLCAPFPASYSRYGQIDVFKTPLH